MTLTNTERKNQENVSWSINALTKNYTGRSNKNQTPWTAKILVPPTNSLNILSISLTLQNYKKFRFCFPGCVFTRSNLHISKRKFQEFSRKKKRELIWEACNSYNNSETKMSKLRIKQKNSSLLRSRTYYYDTTKPQK